LKHAVRFSTVALVGLFILYSVQFLAVISFLPTLLVEQSDLALTTAAFFSGIVAIGNAVGAVLAGPLIKLGVRRRDIIIAGYVLMALFAAIVLLDLFPVPVRIAAAIGFSTSGALVPGTIWTFVPELAERPAQAPIFAGMLIQGSGIGQITGPVLLGGLVDAFGRWDAAVLLTTGASLLGIVLALSSQRRASQPQ
ncbi:MAG: MFS transporter, partial [Hyphomicrobiaceae bacterium]